MEGLNEDGQWIVLMAFIISIGIFFLALLLNQSVLVGQTTAEAVLEFPKNDIQDMRNEVWVIFTRFHDDSDLANIIEDIKEISLARKSALVEIIPDDIDPNIDESWVFHFNNGVTKYTEEIMNNESAYYFHY